MENPSVAEQCRQLYRTQAAAVAAADKQDVEMVGKVVGGFVAPLVVLKAAPSAIFLAGVALVGYGGLLVGRELAGSYHTHCVKMSNPEHIPPVKELPAPQS